jgi:hypothetical protein
LLQHQQTSTERERENNFAQLINEKLRKKSAKMKMRVGFVVGAGWCEFRNK